MDVFCKIISKEVGADILHEDDNLLVIADLHPSAPVHYLIIPKKHITTIHDAQEEDTELLGKMILAAQKAAEDLGISDGYKLAFNVGRKGGQEVDHIHLHLLGGWK